MMQRNGQRVHRRFTLIVILVVAGIGISQTPLVACQAAKRRTPPQEEKKTQNKDKKDVRDEKETPKKREDRLLKSIALLKSNAGRAEWSPKGNEYITYHARGKDNYYDIYIMKNDGSDVRCLTCDSENLPNKNIGQPSWHPSGDWIVFQAEKEKHVLPRFGLLAAPGIGFHNDVWVMTPDGKKVYQLTDVDTKKRLFDRTPASAILQPHFSKNGKLVSWSERVGNGGKWGKWVIRVADFVVKKGTPSLENMRTLTPGANQQYYESNDFMPGDEKLLICGNLEPKQTEFGIDIYYLDLATKKTERLTHSQDVFDECPHPSPDGSKIAFLSTEGFVSSEAGDSKRGEDWWNWVRGEFWLMDAKGGGRSRLTYFNEEGYPEYAGKRVVPAYVSWNSKGDKLLFGVATEVKKGRLEDQLFLAELKK
jgi:Tol biopolymer transport system component